MRRRRSDDVDDAHFGRVDQHDLIFHHRKFIELGRRDIGDQQGRCLDLGQGLTCQVVNATTYEEANTRVGNWIRQRSRWIKGYMQTYLVHMRLARGRHARSVCLYGRGGSARGRA